MFAGLGVLSEVVRILVMEDFFAVRRGGGIVGFNAGSSFVSAFAGAGPDDGAAALGGAVPFCVGIDIGFDF